MAEMMMFVIVLVLLGPALFIYDTVIDKFIDRREKKLYGDVSSTEEDE